ncbi:MAG: hypothetical protein RIF32_03900, partial [Leptospirales bacterium]
MSVNFGKNWTVDELCCSRLLLIFCLTLAGQAAFADEAGDPSGTSAPDFMRVSLLSWLEGARYKPASPAQAAGIRRANANTPGAPAPLLDADAFDPREPISRTDQSQALGLAIAGQGGRSIFYDIQAGLVIHQGMHRFRRDDPPEREAPETDAVVFLPGDQLRLGFRFCEAICEASLGRFGPANAFTKGLTGGHGSLTGVHLNFVHEDYGAIHFTPLYRPELSGSYFPDRKSAAYEAQAIAYSAASESLRSDFRAVAAKSRSYGQRLAYTGRFGWLWIGLDYAVHRQNDTANPGAGSLSTTGTVFRRSIDHIQYTGLGLGIRGEVFSMNAHLQRASGSYRTLLARPRDAASDAGATDETIAERKAAISGSALRSRASLRYGGFALDLDFFLPEPSAKRAPGQSAGSTGSGYVGFGDTPLRSPILAGVLDFRPAPELCPERGLCEGLITRNFAANHAADGDVLETGFRDHAAVLTL